MFSFIAQVKSVVIAIEHWNTRHITTMLQWMNRVGYLYAIVKSQSKRWGTGLYMSVYLSYISVVNCIKHSFLKIIGTFFFKILFELKFIHCEITIYVSLEFIFLASHLCFYIFQKIFIYDFHNVSDDFFSNIWRFDALFIWQLFRSLHQSFRNTIAINRRLISMHRGLCSTIIRNVMWSPLEQ